MHYPRVGVDVKKIRVVSARSGVWTILFGVGYKQGTLFLFSCSVDRTWDRPSFGGGCVR